MIGYPSVAEAALPTAAEKLVSYRMDSPGLAPVCCLVFGVWVFGDWVIGDWFGLY
jgi:hypothetical protein